MNGALNMMPDIAGAALDFTNIIMNVFAGELIPKKAINDFYQLASGGSGSAARNCQVWSQWRFGS